MALEESWPIFSVFKLLSFLLFVSFFSRSSLISLDRVTVAAIGSTIPLNTEFATTTVLDCGTSRTFSLILYHAQRGSVSPNTSMGALYEKPVSMVDATPRCSGSDDTLEPIDRAAEKRLLRKLDLHVLPMISFLYMLAFVDRINIGNARIQGLEKDLHMSGQDYNIALFVFFVPYILLEVPSNIILKKVAPSTWLSVLMFIWGTISSTLHLHRLTEEHRGNHSMHGTD